MGIYIRGMKMPRFSAEYELRLYVDSDGAATVEGAYGCFEGEPFEAVPVPPHGRLIDADELIEHAWRDKLDSRELIAGMIDSASTIIPASGG